MPKRISSQRHHDKTSKLSFIPSEQYPPLFACDNNSNLWETEFEGLVIKNPEELKNLPDDCAIFICNLYYEEIQEQIEAMGLKNPIEWFNDEYLPLKYTDWFDGSERKLK